MAGLALSWLLAVALVALAPTGAPRAAVLAAGLLAGYAAWSYVSIAWADQNGAAWEGANRMALYAVVFALVALWPLRGPRAAAAPPIALGLGVALAGIVVLLGASSAADPSGSFVFGRLTEPTGYANASAALWMLGFWACVAFAARRETPRVLAGALVAGAVVLGVLALMAQSRGWAAAAAVSAVVFLAVMPGRPRAALALLTVAAATAAASGPALAVFERFADGEAPDVGASARTTLLAASAAGLLWALAGRWSPRRSWRPRLPRRGVEGLRVAAVVAVTVAVVAAVIVADPVSTVGDAWDEFTTVSTVDAEQGSRFAGGLGTNRYDFWRVAWDAFAARPLTGVGQENFQQDYLLRGRSEEQPVHPHSIEVRVLSQTGLVGVALFFGAVVVALLAALRIRRRDRGAIGVAVAASVTVFSSFLAHASVDWLIAYPALAGLAFAMLALPCAMLPRRPARPGPRRSRPAARAILVGAPLLIVSASLAAPLLSERLTREAVGSWPTAPRAAFDRLDRAADLNPLATRPALVGGFIALRLGDARRAEAQFRVVQDRDRRDALAALQLGMLIAQRGDRAQGLHLLRRAVRLNPRDETYRQALREVLTEGRADIAAVNAELLQRTENLVR